MPRSNYDIFLNNQELNNYVRHRDYTPTKIDQLFPAIKTQDMKMQSIVGANELPVTASIHAFNAVTEIASRDNINIMEQDKVLIKRQIPLREDLIIKLNSPRNNAERDQLLRTVFNDVDNMYNSVITKARVMAAEALSTGKVTSQDENNLKTLEVDYQLPDEHFVTLSGTSLWTADTATPLDDLFNWSQQIVDDGGERPSFALTSQAVINTLLRHVTIRRAMYGVNFERALNLADLNAFLREQGLPALVAFDEKYRKQKEDGTYEVKTYINSNKVILLPNGAVGKSEYGPTAEEYEMAGDKGNELIHRQNAVVQIYRTPDPVARWTKAVATNIPSFARANEVFIATVKE